MAQELKKSVKALRKNILEEHSITNRTEEKLLKELEELNKQADEAQTDQLHYYRQVVNSIEKIVTGSKENGKPENLGFSLKNLRKTVEDLEKSNPRLVHTVEQIVTVFSNWGLT